MYRHLKAIMLASGLLMVSGPASSGDAVAGRALALNWCAQCHLVAADQERTSDIGPPFAQIANDPAKSDLRITAWLIDPHPPMPKLSLTQKQIGNLVAYIKTLKSD
jgi:mono/diheme cytochrome c family protein